MATLLPITLKDTKKKNILLYQDEHNDIKIVRDKATGQKTVTMKKMKCTCGKKIKAKKFRIVLSHGETLTICHKGIG